MSGPSLRTLSLGAVAACSALSALAQPRPSALAHVQRQRESLQTARIELSRTMHRFLLSPRFYTARLAEADEILVSRGDAEGFHRAPNGSVHPTDEGRPRHTLKSAGETWIHEEGALWAGMEEESRFAEHIPRMRTLGVSYFNSHRDIDETLWRDAVAQPGPREYGERVEDGLHIVTAQTDYGTITWWIDGGRGWSPVRVTLEQDGQIVRESRSTLKRFDGVWYPETVLFFSKHHKDGKEPVETVKVYGAHFNRPEHPRRFGPTDIGVEAGMLVEKQNADGTTVNRPLVWDGTKAVTQEEFGERETVGEIELGPTYRRLLAQRKAKEALQPTLTGRARGEAAGGRNRRARDARTFESEWTAYTRRFIQRYRLDAEQRQKAWGILQHCQQRANAHVARYQAEFERLDCKLRAAQEAKDGKQLLALKHLRAELTAPIERIFQEALKPRLETLPTRAQRRAAEATSRPSPREAQP